MKRDYAEAGLMAEGYLMWTELNEKANLHLHSGFIFFLTVH